MERWLKVIKSRRTVASKLPALKKHVEKWKKKLMQADDYMEEARRILGSDALPDEDYTIGANEVLLKIAEAKGHPPPDQRSEINVIEEKKVPSPPERCEETAVHSPLDQPNDYLQNIRDQIVSRTRVGTKKAVRNIFGWYQQRISKAVIMRMNQAKSSLSFCSTTVEIPDIVYNLWVKPVLQRACIRGRHSAANVNANTRAYLFTTKQQLEEAVDPEALQNHCTDNRGAEFIVTVCCTDERPVVMRYHKQSQRLTVKFWFIKTAPDGVLSLALS